MAPDGTRGQQISTVLLDALGTLVGLEPPVPHLVAALEARGVTVDPAAAGAAVHAEMAHYRTTHHAAGTPDGLRAVRAACAEVMQGALAPAADALDAPAMGAVLLEAFRFFAYPEAPAVLERLRAGGLRLVVCSNWDLSLHEVLARTGLDALVDGAAISAVDGSAKPDAALFARALAIAGEPDPGRALHVGDSITADVLGAHAAGLRPVLITRDGDEVRSHDEAEHAAGVLDGVPVLDDLRGLPALAGLA